MVVKSKYHHTQGDDLGRPPKPKKMLSALASRFMRKKNNPSNEAECHSPRYNVSEHEQDSLKTSESLSFLEERRDDTIRLDSTREPATGKAVQRRMKTYEDDSLLDSCDEALTTMGIQLRMRRLIRSNKKAFRDPEVRAEVTRLYNLIKHVNNDKRAKKLEARRVSDLDELIEMHDEIQPGQRKQSFKQAQQRKKQPKKQLRGIKGASAGICKDDALVTTLTDPSAPFCYVFSSIPCPNTLGCQRDLDEEKREEELETVDPTKEHSTSEEVRVNASSWKSPTENFATYVSSALSTLGDAFYETLSKLDTVQLESRESTQHGDNESEEKLDEDLSLLSSFSAICEADASANTDTNADSQASTSLNAEGHVLPHDMQADTKKNELFCETRKNEMGKGVNVRESSNHKGISFGKRFRLRRKKNVYKAKRIRGKIAEDSQDGDSSNADTQELQNTCEQERTSKTQEIGLDDTPDMPKKEQPEAARLKDRTEACQGQIISSGVKSLERQNSIDSSKVTQQVAKQQADSHDTRCDNHCDTNNTTDGQPNTSVESDDLGVRAETLKSPLTQQPIATDNKPVGAEADALVSDNGVTNKVTPAASNNPLGDGSSSGKQQLDPLCAGNLKDPSMHTEPLKKAPSSEHDKKPGATSQPTTLPTIPSLQSLKSYLSNASAPPASVGPVKSQPPQSKDDSSIRLCQNPCEANKAVQVETVHDESVLSGDVTRSKSQLNESDHFSGKTTDDSMQSYILGFLLAHLAFQRETDTQEKIEQHLRMQQTRIPVPKEGTSLFDILKLLQQHHAPRLSKGFLTYILAEFAKQAYSVDKEALRMGYLERLFAKPAALVPSEHVRDVNDVEHSKPQEPQVYNANASMSASRSFAEQITVRKEPIELQTSAEEVSPQVTRSRTRSVSLALFSPSSIQAGESTEEASVTPTTKSVKKAESSQARLKGNVDGFTPFSYFKERCSCFSSEQLYEPSTVELDTIALAVEQSIATLRDDDRCDDTDDCSDAASSSGHTEKGAGTSSLAFSDIDAWFDFLENTNSTSSSDDEDNESSTIGSEPKDKLPSFDVSEWMLQE